MTSSAHAGMLTRRRRAVAAMGLGPLWTARAGSAGVVDPSSAEPDDVRLATIAAMDRSELVVAIERCRACALGATRRRTVSGDGPDNAAWLLVGRAPDGDDENAATAYAGTPGKLLTAMLGSIGITRDSDAFVTHRVKCRPPGDRRPTSDEIARCRPFFLRQAALTSAQFVVSLGDEGSMDPGGIDVVVPDPRELLVDPELKAAAWTALCEVRRISDERRGSTSTDPFPSAEGYDDGGASRAASTR